MASTSSIQKTPILGHCAVPAEVVWHRPIIRQLAEGGETLPDAVAPAEDENPQGEQPA